MTSFDSVEPSVEEQIRLAAQQLRADSDERALQVAPRVLREVFNASRRSLPVRAQDGSESTFISEGVIISSIRETIEQHAIGAAPGAIHLRVGRDHGLQEVRVDLVGQYGHALSRSANLARAATEVTLTRLLGPREPGVRVVVSHLHFGDVTARDPRYTDPSDDDLST